jgi:DNA modification methylase
MSAVEPRPESARTSRRPPVRDRVTELVRVRAGDLIPNPANWRRHPERQRAALRGLLREIGYADALLARREGEYLVLIDGHLRQGLDPDQIVPVLVLDVTKAESQALLATLDPLAALALPDPEALARLLETVKSSSGAVNDLLEGLARDAGLALARLHTDPDEAPPLPEEPRTRPGDLWLLGQHRLLCGDSTKAEDVVRLMNGERADLLLTDPPYGVDYVGKTARELKIRGDAQQGLGGLLAASFARAGEVLAEGAAVYVFHPAGAQSVTFLGAFVAQGWRLHQTLVWVKDSLVLGHADYHYRHEWIAYGYAPGGGRRGRGGAGWHGGNAQDSVLEVARPAASREHPTMKPVALLRRLLENSSAPRERVLDPFAGSGSTLVAAELLGRRAFCMELDPRYCDVIVERYERASGNGATRQERATPSSRRTQASDS